MLTRLKGTGGGEGGRGLKIALVPHLPFLVCTRYAPKGGFLHQGIYVAPYGSVSERGSGERFTKVPRRKQMRQPDGISDGASSR